MSGATSADAVESERGGDVQRAMDALANSPEVVGAIGELYVDGERVGRGSAGTRLLDGEGGHIPSSARYRVGSQTKQMTATVLLQLVEEGRLGLDDTLADVLPVVAERDLVERAEEITVRQLIRHTSGIPDFFATRLPDSFDMTTRYRPVDLVKMSRRLPPTGNPGERFSYSNTNYFLLGMIIERETGNSLATELMRRIFVPAGMSRSYLTSKPPEGIRGPHGHGYYPDPQGRLHDMDRLNASYGWAAGGVVSTARDVSAFQRAFAQNKLLPAEPQRVITDPPEGAPPPSGRLCGGTPQLRAVAGSAPGYNAVTFTTADGRSQFAVSATLRVHNADPAVQAALNRAAEAVFCPK
ncbi:serine hydrolase domain-containing protein [Spirillospora sp. CA-294931]|uniref:serine hydrolase domain-containing protein n=1 Tax=Spirillospora sp. CA-294931 TaxID=3240042 RepID=UPI003D94B01E